MDNCYFGIYRGDIMINISKKRIRKNTLENRLESLKDENNSLKAKVLLLQDDIISLQKINLKQKDELLEYKNKSIKKLKEKNKRSDK